MRIQGREGLAAVWHGFYVILYVGAALFHGLSVYTHLRRARLFSKTPPIYPDQGCRCTEDKGGPK